jgi:NAD(P)-dependent dehydrogenase (short-subunit alcohol dehydrogenase family)
MTGLEGRHAVVTGGSRGIGRAIAAALVTAGATVTISGRKEADLKDTVAAGAASGYFTADATDEKAMAAGIAQTETTHGAVDILVANAGGAESVPFHKSSIAQFRQMIDVNLMSVVHAAHAVVGGMIARKSGRIIAIASTGGLKGYPYISGYVAAKHGVVGLVKSLALETAKHGITVNAICPSYTETDMVMDDMKRAAEKSGKKVEDILAGVLRDKPLGRLIKPEEVAASVVFLASPAASAITGTTLAVAGGEL